VLTVVETLLFQRRWALYWTEEERGVFAAYIAARPTVKLSYSRCMPKREQTTSPAPSWRRSGVPSKS